jgi:TFIIH basal transcription factor complex TTD-A subunit
MPRAIRGVLVECDPSIKSIIVSIDSKNNHEYIVEDLDEQRVVIKENMVAQLKKLLDEKLSETHQQAEESGSE